MEITAALGQGGVGKRVLACEVVHRLRERVPLLGWVPCERVDVSKKALVALDRKLGCGIANDEEEDVALHKVLDELQRRRGEWLPVFDNAEDVVELEKLLPKGGHVLIDITAHARKGA